MCTIRAKILRFSDLLSAGDLALNGRIDPIDRENTADRDRGNAATEENDEI